ncbi:MAG: hypothetical protein ABSE49_13190 [Polyangiaceae bacterium]|jgi:hypothetical protein
MMSVGGLACGGSTSNAGAPAPSPEAGASEDEGGPVTTPVEAGAPVEAAAPIDHGAPSTTYPAFAPSGGQLLNSGATMTAPVVVAITWSSDTSAPSFDGFADDLGTTSYWTQTAGSWGIGPVTSGMVNHVSVTTAPPATMTETNSSSDFQNMVTMYAGVAGPTGWPAPTTNTIYAFFLAPGTSAQLSSGQGSAPSDACAQGIGGWHSGMTVNNVATTYAVVPSCTFPGGNTAAQQTTMSMSHEVNEAASDPQGGGVYGFQDDSFAFDYFQDFQSEDGDACEFFIGGPDSSFYEDIETTPTAFDYWVQRIWSNKSFSAGHNPCVPVPSGAYFNVTPLDAQTVTVANPQGPGGSSSAATFTSKGYKALAGDSVTFAVGFYSDAATTGPWNLSAYPGNPITGSQDELVKYNPSSVSVSLDKTSGTNGEKAYVTVKVKTTGSLFKGELVTITSSLDGVEHYMPIWIAGQ